MLQIAIIGNLVADAEKKTGKDGREYALMRVAVDELNGDVKNTTYFDVRSPLNGTFEFLVKGQQVYVLGNLSASAVLHEGKAYLNMNVWARTLEICFGGRK